MFNIGDRVELTEKMKKVAINPEKYISGTITEIGCWNILSVKWNGIDRPIMMRADEIQHA